MLRLLFSSVKNVMSVSMFNVQLSAIVIVIAKTDIYMYVVVAMLPCLVEGQLKKVSQRFFLLACGIHTMGPRQAF